MNEAIQAAREVALDILKPSQKELEHGLELHRNSLVVESYGLGLLAPAAPDRVNAMIDAGASATEIQDCMGDQRALRWAETAELRREYREAWEASGVCCSFINAGEESNSPVQLLKRLSRRTYFADEMPDLLARATTPDDIEAAFKAGKRCQYLTCNGVPLQGTHVSPEEELGLIAVFARLGVRTMHLTYNRRNLLADGCGEPADGGLSDFGGAAVREMNRLGVIVDLAHTGWKSCLDAARVSTQPVIVSHSAAAAVHHHIRCKPDDVIRAVLDTGGAIGITNVPAFLGGPGDISAFLDHIDYVVKTFGPDGVTIGTDQAYIARDLYAMDAKIRFRGAGRDGWEQLWPPNDPLFQKDIWRRPRQSLVWTNWPLYTVGLVQRGHSDEVIQKILGLNLMRIARKAWEGSSLNTGLREAAAQGEI